MSYIYIILYYKLTLGRESHLVRTPWLTGIAFFGPAICMILNATIGPSLGTVAQAIQWDRWDSDWNIVAVV